jgi:hypothetical protein
VCEALQDAVREAGITYVTETRHSFTFDLTR